MTASAVLEVVAIAGVTAAAVALLLIAVAVIFLALVVASGSAGDLRDAILARHQAAADYLAPLGVMTSTEDDHGIRVDLNERGEELLEQALGASSFGFGFTPAPEDELAARRERRAR